MCAYNFTFYSATFGHSPHACTVHTPMHSVYICILNCVLYPHSLLVAIGIEAFNKFSQEQKDEEKEAESQFPSSITYSENTNRTVKEDISHYGQKLLIGLGYFAKAAFSSARVRKTKYTGWLFWASLPHLDGLYTHYSVHYIESC